MLQNMPSLLAAATAVAALSLPRAVTASSQLSFATKYEVPAAFLAAVAGSDSSDSCVTPQSYSVELFQVWTPDAGNANKMELSFGYRDAQTNVTTGCVVGASSAETSSGRYTCANPAVQFVWRDGTVVAANETMAGAKLTMIEKVCAGSTGSTPWEVSGSVVPTLNCVATTNASNYGAGQDCLSQAMTMTVEFTSLEPEPPAEGSDE